jgi:hypothetical protein
MANLYVDTGGSATNSGSRDANAAALSGTAATVSGTTVTLDGSPDLSGVNVSGDNQDSIYLNQATNANQKIFWITAVDNSAKTVTVSVAPTGVTSSSWAIGGRITLAGLTGFESVLRAGDTVNINNSQASVAGTCITLRVAGSTSDGYVKIKGAAGVYPSLTTSTTAPCIVGNVAFQWIEGLTVVQQGATGNAINLSGTSADNWMILNNKITDAGEDGINGASGASGTRAVMNEISGCGRYGINCSDNIFIILFNYIHDCTNNGIYFNFSTNVQVACFNIIDTCGGRGILKTGATTNVMVILSNAIYNCDDSGMELSATTLASIINNILLDNGNAAGEFNFEFYTDAMKWIYSNYNNLSIAGARGGSNYTNYTEGSGDVTGSPSFTNAPAGDFSIGSGSAAKATGFPGAFPGGLSTGYMDMGPIQRQEPAGGGGGGLLTNPGMAGGMRG